MKKQLVFFICFLLISSILIGQNPPIVLVSSTGKISYTNGKNEPMRVASGAALDPNGTVTLPDKVSAMIFCNGEYKKLSKGKNSLMKLCGGTANTRSLNVDGRIGDFIITSLQIAVAADGHNSGWAKVTDPKNFAGDGWGGGGKDGWGGGGKDGFGGGGKDGWGGGGKDGFGGGGKDGWGAIGKDGWGGGGKDGFGGGGKDGFGGGGKDGWGTGGKDGFGGGGKDGFGGGGKDGWGGTGKKIHLILPIGKLEAKMTHFSWSRPSNTTSYKLEIQDANKKIVHTVIVKDTFADIDLKKLVINHEEMYSWMVTSVENAESVSNVYQFAIESMDAKKATEAKLSKSKIYAKADHTTQSLMETVVLESDEWYYDAAQIFSSLKKKNANNNLVNMMHAAFWMRSGVTQLAEAAIMP